MRDKVGRLKMSNSNKNHPVGCACQNCSAADLLAQGSNKSVAVPTAWNQKDQNADGQKYTKA